MTDDELRRWAEAELEKRYPDIGQYAFARAVLEMMAECDGFRRERAEWLHEAISATTERDESIVRAEAAERERDAAREALKAASSACCQLFVMGCATQDELDEQREEADIMREAQLAGTTLSELCRRFMQERDAAIRDLSLSHAQHADVTGRMAAETEQAERERDAAIRDRAEAHERAGYCADQMVVAQAERDAALAVLRSLQGCNSGLCPSCNESPCSPDCPLAACLRGGEGNP